MGGVAPDSERDRTHMRHALALAAEGWGQTAPNPMVGAIVAQGDEVVGAGYHARYGGDHAEVVALRAAGDRARGATVYVTLEPCAHHGKTPPCTDALIAAKVKRVVAGVPDPNPEARGGAERLKGAGIDVELGVEEAAARELNAPFFFSFAADRPWVTLKLALSLDGAVSDATRSVGWITSPASRREVHRLRAGSDAVAVGVGTAVADDPMLDVRDWRAPRAPPLRVVFDRHARLAVDSRLARTARELPTIVMATEPDAERAAALRAVGVEVTTARSMRGWLVVLRDRGIRSLLVEGGAQVAGALLSESLVDRLIIFQAPLVLGRGALNAFAYAPATSAAVATRLPVVGRAEFDGDLMTAYSFRSP